MLRYLLLLPFLFLLSEITAQGITQALKDTTDLNEILLIATPVKSSVQNAASSVAVLSAKDIEQTDEITIAQVLNKVPGIYMQQGALNTNRITIRGIGSRSPFSTNRVKAYFGNIPLSTGEGETVMEDLSLESIKRIEIIKGPNSSLYGAGLGGVIHLYPEDTPLEEAYAKAETVFGSYNLFKRSLSAGIGKEKYNLFTNYCRLTNDGYRENSDYDRQSFNLFGNASVSEKGQLSFIGIFTDLKAFIPSSLSLDNFNENPEMAASNWNAAKGFESYDKWLLGINYTHNISEKLTINSSIFGNFRDAYEPRPFDISKEESSSYGARLKGNYSADLFNLPVEVSIGSELYFEDYEFSLFENLYQSQPGQGSIQGEKFAQVRQDRNYVNIFSHLAVWLNSKLRLETGFAINSTTYTLEEVFEQDQGGSQDFSFESAWSPRLGLSYEIEKGKNIYASINRGFSVPTVAETLTPAGAINTTLRPETGTNYEIGLKANWLKNRLYTEIALYSIQINNLIVARRIAEDRYVGINAGETGHNGLEFLLRYEFSVTEGMDLISYFSGNLNDFRFDDFVDDETDFSGNELTGVPGSTFNAGITLRTKRGFNLYASYRYVDEIPLNDANTLYSRSYNIFDSKASYRFIIFDRLQTEISAGINNIFDEKYAASILPNAVGFGNSQPRYFYPGNPRNFFGGISISYNF